MSISDDETGLFLTDGTLRSELLGHGTSSIFQEAVRQANESNWDTIRTAHIFMGLLAASDPAVRNWGKRVGIDAPKLLTQFRELFHQNPCGRQPITDFRRPFVSDHVDLLLRAALDRAASRGRACLIPMDLLVVLFTTKTIVAECFEKTGVSPARLVEIANSVDEENGNPSSAAPTKSWWRFWG